MNRYEDQPSLPFRIVRGLWRVFDGACRFALNVFVAVLAIALLAALFSGGGPEVPKGAALVVDPAGTLVEQKGGKPLDRALDELTGQGDSEVLLEDVIVAIREAKDDPKIGALVLKLDDLGGGGLTKLQELQRAVISFKESGKKVVAIGENYGQNGYLVAAAADEILLHPFGMVLVEGYGRYRNYYKDAIDKVEADWNIFRVGKFKSAMEPYLRNDMSPEDREASLEFLNDLWATWLDTTAAARGIERAKLESYVANYPALVEAAGGDGAKVALEAGIVDALVNRHELRAKIIELVGEDEDTKSFKQIGYASYLEAIDKAERKAPTGGPAIAVVVAKGEILDGAQPPGLIGGDTASALIRDAREDEDVKAIVLRVDSPGGSAFASELIREELARARADGKKVVVSMGSVAASGGYWIATSSDEIWASPATITGSIGIFGSFPTFERTLAKIGVHTDGVGTTPLAGAIRLDRTLPDEAKIVIQRMIEKGYQQFLERVAEARGMTIEQVDEIAQGRVWSGLDAKRLGLVDQLGELDDAIKSAAKLAGLEEGDYKVRPVISEPSFKEKLMGQLLSQAASVVGPWAAEQRPVYERFTFYSQIQRDLERLARMNDPHGVYALCLVDVE